MREFPSAWGELTCVTSVLLALKDKGNKAFARGDYNAAVLCYSEGLNKVKDMKVLYTNRAQVSEPALCPWLFSQGTVATELVKPKMRLDGSSVVPNSVQQVVLAGVWWKLIRRDQH